MEQRGKWWRSKSSLFEFKSNRKARAIGDKVQKVRERFGLDVIRTANEL